jgi:hypothetical protein
MTNSFVNHSSLVMKLSEYEGKERRRFTTEALEHGIVLNYLSRRIEQYDGEVWWYPLKDEWNERRGAIGEMGLAFIGVPYDYQSILRQLVGKVSTDIRRLFYILRVFGGCSKPGRVTKFRNIQRSY